MGLAGMGFFIVFMFVMSKNPMRVTHSHNTFHLLDQLAPGYIGFLPTIRPWAAGVALGMGERQIQPCSALYRGVS